MEIVEMDRRKLKGHRITQIEAYIYIYRMIEDNPENNQEQEVRAYGD